MNEFIARYGKETLDDLIEVLNSADDFKHCDDDMCDDEECILIKAFNKFLKYK
ncbi:hypothetical protein Phi46:1_gp44 [Cellulophaga phage phi46:1]|uniref:hypothetical protein n=1 Tax=Cellulophaga phage phi46:1 TaxID=1327974 RepID=UPI0003514D33|nr:hypothetical protein Phi46:1_gp44 [Cellulophaga phage phi46:1]AGO47855.1 hypothetical protein Phi46:1_gp44 [Cellulophaga phage phi46:1]